MKIEIPSLILNNGRTMPAAGLGTYRLADAALADAVQLAAGAGCRLFDTAAYYKNEEDLGDALRATGIPRGEFFVITKIWNTAQRFGDVRSAFLRSLERLGLEYVDLYMIHWPVSASFTSTWNTMEELLAEGLARSIGVANFEIEHLEQLRKVSDIVPAVNQIECHPLWDRSELIHYCQENGITVQAYAPLARGAYLDRETIITIANKYRRSPAQIGLRYLHQLGLAVIPKSSSPERILSNLDIFDFSLTEADMQMIRALNEHYRVANIPEDMQEL